MSKIDTIVAKLQKEFTGANVMTLSAVPKLDVISTGIPNLDYATGVGGWPRRLVTEVFGEEHMGKSVLAFKAMASTQKMGLIPALISSEGIPDPNWAALNGVDLDSAIVLFAFNIEQLVEQAKTISANEDIALMVIDSLAGVGTKTEMLEGKPKQAYGNSGHISQMMHALLPNVWQTNKACVLMNQVRDKMAGTYLVLDSPGGHSLHHGASLRVQLKSGSGGKAANTRMGKVGGIEKEIAKQVVAVVKKNKAASPSGEAAYWIWHDVPDDMTGYPGRGVDIVGPLIDTGMMLGIVEQKGAYYNIVGLDFKQEAGEQGKPKLEAWLREDYVRVDKLYELVKKQLEEHYEQV